MNLRIETTRLILRQFTESDAAGLYTAIDFQRYVIASYGKKEFK